MAAVVLRACLLVAVTVAAARDLSPWIGILGVPTPHCASRYQGQPGGPSGSCFTSLYDKFVQMAGARVVGIPHDAFDQNKTALDELLASVNGVLFTGGGLDLSDKESSYHRTGRYIFEQTKAFNDAGIYYPLQGHCMGLQFLSILAAEDNASVLLTGEFDSEGLSLPLQWTDAAQQSTWIRSMPSEIYNTFTHQNSTTNLHHDGVTPTAFFTNPLLPDFFTVLSTNRDRKGKEFISTIEAKRYPIRGMQWHPERNLFDWRVGEEFDHSPEAVAANGWISVSFVAEARRHTPQARNEQLLSEFCTYGMAKEIVGSVVNGIEYLVFPGFEVSKRSQEPVLVYL